MSLNNNQEAAQTREQLKEQTRTSRNKSVREEISSKNNRARTEKKGLDFKAYFGSLVETVGSWIPKRDRVKTEKAPRVAKAGEESTATSDRALAKVRKKRIRIRLFPIWLRILLITIFIAASALAGVYVGYGVIGEGNPEQTFDKSTWQHILDLVNGE